MLADVRRPREGVAMSGENGEGQEARSDPSADFLKHLEEAGFFKQIAVLEANLKTIADDLKTLGQATIERTSETETLVAHVLAIEAILKAMIQAAPIDFEAVRDVIGQTTAAATGGTDGNPKVAAIAETIVKPAGGGESSA
jgi:hypothetical protein